MKKFTLPLFFFFIAVFNSSLNAQNVGINASGASPSASAMLDVSSTTSGMLVPRMTAAQRGAIASPATGLLVYQTDAGTQGAGFYFHNGTAWVPLSTNSGAWGLTGNTGTTPSAATYGSTVNNNFIGTTDANAIVFATNNLERMRINPTDGEVVIGAQTSGLAGDALCAVSNSTLTWAVNGYSTQNGSGVFGKITSGSTNYAGVQGEYNGTSTTGAGVRGIALNTSSIGVIGVENTGNGWAGYFNGDVNCVAGFAYYNLSDKRLKKNEKVINNALSKLSLINGYEYDFNVEDFGEYIPKQSHKLGVMAQEIEKVFPELVVEKSAINNKLNYSRNQDSKISLPNQEQKFKAVNYDGLIPVLIQAIKEQQTQIEDLKIQIQVLQKK